MEGTLVSNALDSEGLFAVTECFHILGFALTIGTIGMIDFCMLGVGPPASDAGKMAKDLWPWTLVGLTDVLFSGLLLYAGNDAAASYFYNSAFRFKMVCLILAITYNYTIHRGATVPGFSPGLRRFVALGSLVLWLGVLTGGLFIGFAVA
jgi:hypothetical protein